MDTEQIRKGGALWIPACTLVDASREAAEKAHMLAGNSLCFAAVKGRISGWVPCTPDLGGCHFSCSVRRTCCGLFLNSLAVRIIVPDSGQTSLLRKKIFSWKRDCFPALCATVRIGSPWLQKAKDITGRYRDYFAHIHPARKIPLSLTQRTTSPCSGGCKHFKIQLCDKVNAWRYWDVLCFFLATLPLVESSSHLFAYWCLCLMSFRVSDDGHEHISGVQACPRIEREITVTGKTALVSGELGWGRINCKVSVSFFPVGVLADCSKECSCL